MRPIWSVILVAGTFDLLGCGPMPDAEVRLDSKPVYVRPKAKPDVVECLDARAESPAWISNGSVGVRVGRDGSGSIVGDGSTTILDISNYTSGGEERIVHGPCPLPLNVCLDSVPILSKEISEYRQIQKLTELPNSLEATWKQGESAISVSNSVDSHGRIAFRLQIYPTKARMLTFEYDSPQLDQYGDSGFQPGFEYFTESADNPRIVRVSGNGDITYDIKVSKHDGKTKFEIPIRDDQFFIILEHDFGPPYPYIEAPLKRKFADIEIDGPVEDQQAIRSFLTYLRGSIPGDGRWQVSPFNTSSTTYSGHVFWDADVWVFPALALLDPERAKTIPNYRIEKAGAAEKNFKERRSWVRNPPSAEAVAKIDAVQYPWESSVSGLEVSPTETKQEHHITGDVVWGLDLAASLGLADPKKVQEIGKKAAAFYRFRSTAIERGDDEASHYQIHNYRTILDTISPDELYFGDHDLYTNALAEWVIRRFAPEDRGYPFFLPKDGASHLNYAGDRLRGYKQAAGALAIYPLQNPFVEREAKTFMDRFADKVSKNGPAMADSLHALIWARLGERDRAYETWRKSWMDFTNHPLMLFSEKRNKDATYFSTGAAGCLQTVLYGFLGIRIDSKPQTGAKWSTPLLNGKVLSIKPNLPKEWRSIKVNGLTILGNRYSVVATNETVVVQTL